MSVNKDIVFNSADFIELLIKHIIRSEIVYNEAKRLKLTSDDFVLSDEFGIQIYKIFIDIALSIQKAPISQELFAMHLKTFISSSQIHPTLQDQVIELFCWIYNSDLDESYVLEQLKQFLKNRRQEKIKIKYSDDNDRLTSELNKVAFDFSVLDSTENIIIASPFTTLIKKSIFQLIPTAMSKLDCGLGGGFARSEFGIIVGFSGNGKTALSTFIAGNMANLGYKVAFISYEEGMEEISGRFYSRFCKINAADLRSGVGYLEMEQKFHEKENEETFKILQEKLKVFALKGQSPMSPKRLEEILVNYFEETGWNPDVVIVDQMQFMEPNYSLENEQQWLKEKRIAEDLDILSHIKIGGTNFVLIVNHQAKGKVKKIFTRDDIDGFKGIIHKPEFVIGIGRELNDFCIFSLKSRSSKDFAINYKGHLEYMSFEEPEEVKILEQRNTTFNIPDTRKNIKVTTEQRELIKKTKDGVVSNQCYE